MRSGNWAKYMFLMPELHVRSQGLRSFPEKMERKMEDRRVSELMEFLCYRKVTVYFC